MANNVAWLFYSGDWRKDPELCRCTKAEKGVWIDCLAILDGCPVRGVFCSADGSPWSDDEIARAIGGDIAENMECLAGLLRKGVAHRNPKGAIYSRRMVRDSEKRIKERTKKRDQRNVPSDVPTSVPPLSETEKEREGFVLPVWIPEEAWKQYELMRVKLGKRMTDHARSLAVKKLEDLMNVGHDPEAVLNQSVFNSWQGLFEVKDGTHQGKRFERTNAATARSEANDDAFASVLRARHGDNTLAAVCGASLQGDGDGGRRPDVDPEPVILPPRGH